VLSRDVSERACPDRRERRLVTPDEVVGDVVELED